jgi:hypothetical protein
MKRIARRALEATRLDEQGGIVRHHQIEAMFAEGRARLDFERTQRTGVPIVGLAA